MENNRLKHKLYIIIFGHHTRAGRIFDIALIIAILMSLAVLVLHSIEGLATEWDQTFVMLEYFFTAIFTLEYLLRLYCSPKPKATPRASMVLWTYFPFSLLT
ncbi:possible potassium channel VIC family [Vibrio variabilis]|uniref:Possible potassium channel VIC family n=1 Tax=Vibrio variabilis TaxID=990271 RepID=A0ABQ0JPX2_9VIBR|nr:possible potassium channel VIC family [Vibrio variabilis]